VLTHKGIPFQRFWLLVAGIGMLASCATYHQKNMELMSAVQDGRIDEAGKILEKPKAEGRKKDALLYYFNRGTVYWMLRDPVNSNKYFQQADYYIEDFQKNYVNDALGLLSNPMVEPYAGEGFEQILLHYYTTLNYIQLGNFEGALVECKRMQLKMQRINDTYKGKNSYKRDAFAHLLTGIIYDAQKNYNDAFIAYRNAYEVYRDDYKGQLNTAIPEQLKYDLIRTAYRTGFYDEVRMYEYEFGRKYQPACDSCGSLLVFWNNGLGPVKDEWSINFFIAPAGDNAVVFYNPELNIRMHFPTSDEHQKKDLSDLKIIRVAFPKYVTREPLFTGALLAIDSLPADTAGFQMAEPINAIAYKSLNDRMMKEFGEALLRLAIKQITESQVKKKNEGLGAVVGLINAITEQADTRNWQLLPYAIYYKRITLPAGKHQVILQPQGGDVANASRSADVLIQPDELNIQFFYNQQFKKYSKN
jgi:hypothetical protein